MIPRYDSAVSQISLDLFTPEGAPARPDQRELELESYCLAGALQMREAARRKDAREPAQTQQPLAADWGPHQIESPSEEDSRAMRELSITFEDGSYRLGPLRYHRLADALACARLRRTHRSAGLQY